MLELCANCKLFVTCCAFYGLNLIYKAKHSSNRDRDNNRRERGGERWQLGTAAGVDGSSRSVSGKRKRGLETNKFAITSNLKVINTPGNDKTFK